jgi:putative transposase
VSDQDKDAEILALRHQITVLQRQLGTNRPRFSPADRAFLAALLHRIPKDVLGRFRLLVRPDTVLRSPEPDRLGALSSPAARVYHVT